MKKFSTVLLLLISSFAFALDVNQDELKSGQSEAVQFENYAGPHAVIDSADSIIAIGTRLGKEVALDIENPGFIQPGAKYSVYHAVGSDEKGLDADILILNKTAGVDHINNLRRIITGYLMAAYGYSRDESESISVFVTVYNAVYRKNLSNFEGKYKSAVMTQLSEESVGLSTNWEEWPGNTQIVIPLGFIAVGEGAVETSVISDDKVIEALRSEEGKNVDVRETLTDIKEKEASTASEKAKTAQKEAAQAKKEGNKEVASQSSKAATEQQLLADKKTEEVKTERDQIAKDKEDNKKSEAEKQSQGSAASQKYLTSLFVVDAKNKYYSLMTVNPENGEIIKKSPVKQIREKNIYTVSDGFVCVCGINEKNFAVKLCLIDSETLEIKKQTVEILSENSSLVQHNDSFYVIIEENGKNYIASYDKNLNLKNKSEVSVNGSSPLNVYSEGILVTDEKGKPVLLSLPALKSVWK